MSRNRYSAWLWLLFSALLGFTPHALAQGFDLSRIESSAPLPVSEVIAGRHDSAFQPVTAHEITSQGRAPRWWRIVVRQNYPLSAAPQLVLTQPYRKALEVWRPGDAQPVRRSTYGPDADFSHTTRFHVVPLDAGLRAGDVLYLRVESTDVVTSKVSIEPSAQVTQREVVHVYLRGFVLSALVLVAMLAFGFWIGLGQRGYAYLGLTLLAQTLSLSFSGGEMRWLSWLAPFADDRRTYIVLNTAAVLASLRFVVFFLGLPATQPRVTRLLNVCSALLGGLLVASLYDVWSLSALFGNSVLLASIALIVVAITQAIRRKQREAYFLLLAWTPLMVILVTLVGSYERWWPAFDWLEFAFPFGLAFGGIGLLLGLTIKLQQLRKDRDTAHRKATFDPLTGVLTRSALQDALREAVEEAHKTAQPLCFVFVDVDHFKRINDEHGHHAGDEALRAVAQHTRQRLRANDIVGRYGGDELVLGLVNTTLPNAVGVAEQVRQLIRQHPPLVDGRRIPIDLSQGVAELAPGESYEKLLKRADAALFASKTAGRGRVSSHPTHLEATAP